MSWEIFVPKIVPTILSENPGDYQARIERVKPFAKRIHVDVADGVFAPSKTVNMAQVYGIDGAELDLHMMVQQPELEVENILAVEPSLVILHFESDGNLAEILNQFKQVGIRIGLGIKPDTTVEQVKDLLPSVDHLLVFCGTLGHNGGEFHAEMLEKIAQAKAINPNLEVGVDGGISQETCHLAVDSGADILDVGSAIHDAPDPEAAFIGLEAIAAGES
jgi:ribulose-phosphate 3-epimerase